VSFKAPKVDLIT